MSNQDQGYWEAARKASQFWNAERQGRHKDVGSKPGLFRYTVVCVGMMKSIYAYPRAYNAQQALDKARAMYPRLMQYNIVKEEPVAAYGADS